MEVVDTRGMKDVTFRKVTHSEFDSKYSGVLVRFEVEGVEVAFVREKEDVKGYRIIVLYESKAIYSEHYPDDYDKAYKAYREQVLFVRSFFIQNGRKAIYYFEDKDHNEVPVIYS